MTRRHETGLLDTNVVIGLPEIHDPGVLPARPRISTITLAELAAGPFATDDPDERARRYAHLQHAHAVFAALPFDSAAASAFGSVAAHLRASGRARRARAYDALIAAVAIANQLPLYTFNADDFIGIPDLQLVALHSAA